MHLRLSLENRVLYSIPDLLLKTQFVYSPSQLQLLKNLTLNVCYILSDKIYLNQLKGQSKRK